MPANSPTTVATAIRPPRVTTKAIEALLRKWADLLHVDSHWAIELHVHDGEVSTPSGSDCSAYCSFAAQRWTAEVHVSRAHSLEDLEHDIIHELLELLSFEKYEICWNLIDAIDPNGTAPAYRAAISESYKAANNRFIERLIPAIVKAGAR